MHSYHIAQRDLTWKEQMQHTVLPTAAILVLFLLGWRIASHRWPSVSIVTIAVIANFAQAFFGKRQEPEYDLEGDEGDGLRLVSDGSVKRKVRRDHLHYVAEWGSGPFKRLVVSEHGPLLTRLLGGIGVPASLPQYEKIRSLALSWLKDS
jgi:hypothetical protein